MAHRSPKETTSKVGVVVSLYVAVLILFLGLSPFFLWMLTAAIWMLAAAFFVCVRCAQLHWPERPRRTRRAMGRRRGKQLELPNAARALT